jgi:hypothetical protein
VHKPLKRFTPPFCLIPTVETVGYGFLFIKLMTLVNKCKNKTNGINVFLFYLQGITVKGFWRFWRFRREWCKYLIINGLWLCFPQCRGFRGEWGKFGFWGIDYQGITWYWLPFLPRWGSNILNCEGWWGIFVLGMVLRSITYFLRDLCLWLTVIEIQVSGLIWLFPLAYFSFFTKIRWLCVNNKSSFCHGLWADYDSVWADYHGNRSIDEAAGAGCRGIAVLCLCSQVEHLFKRRKMKSVNCYIIIASCKLAKLCRHELATAQCQPLKLAPVWRVR